MIDNCSDYGVLCDIFRPAQSVITALLLYLQWCQVALSIASTSEVHFRPLIVVVFLLLVLELPIAGALSTVSAFLLVLELP